MREAWWKRKIAGRVPVWAIALIGGVIVIAAVIATASSQTVTPDEPQQIKITDKVLIGIQFDQSVFMAS